MALSFTPLSGINCSRQLEVFVIILAVLFSLIMLFATVQVLRIFYKVPELGWTTQKLFMIFSAILGLGAFKSLIFIPVRNPRFPPAWTPSPQECNRFYAANGDIPKCSINIIIYSFK